MSLFSRCLVVLGAALVSCRPAAAPEQNRLADEEAIADVVAGLTEAWGAGDAQAWAAHFAEDARFTVWFGLRLRGREEIAFGHNIIFDSFYSGTVFDLSIDDLMFPSKDIAVAQLSGQVLRDGESRTSEPDAVPLAVFRRIEAGWEIIVFQNTPSAVPQLREFGDLDRFKTWAESLADSAAVGGAAP